MIKQCYTLGKKEVVAYIPKNTSYIELENLYDICNELFDEDCFYTHKEVLKLMKDRNNNFLKKH